jgi:hypothetical protein
MVGDETCRLGGGRRRLVGDLVYVVAIIGKDRLQIDLN